MRRLLCVTALTTVLTGCLSASPAMAETGQTGPGWTACPADPRQECATIQVPMDYQDPAKGHVSLAISRIRTAKPETRRGVLLLIPGGPGNSGLSRPLTHGMRLPREVLDRYDLVGFDPRGVGASTPITCGLSSDDAHLRNFHPWPGPGGDITANVARARRVAEACTRVELARHITTRNEARDIDQIRQALGERKLSYWGVSYGTYVGAVYTTMFPSRTDRAVLDSSDDPDPRRVARGWLNNFAVGVEDRFPDFAAWATARESTYGLGDVRATYLALTETHPDLRAYMFQGLYSDSTFPLLAEYMRALRAGDPLPTIPLPPPDQHQNAVAVLTATGCNDVAWPRSAGHYARAVARDRLTYPLTAGMPQNITACAFWPYRQAEPATRIAPSSKVLMIQNRRDPATPYSAGLKMRDALRAPLVSVDAGGHGAYFANGNACGNDAVTAFLVHGTRADRDC
ncbi:alpha/beta hydrolase [Kibdelosporangium persicum]|uniref:Pimeloyl-ACP methyl ester carboxylesterase n=1 Tax=Kibdelosporangium persicum TaxID=2698649 RepID=A0ABX2EYT3_9PSEU|nr:alpha/beta hydrolase [Kibdelosporangium persicum]NRN64174.1 Pimeloyl-ACP methyl ester carboxylesterase [Kibdelosporangium persicum]